MLLGIRLEELLREVKGLINYLLQVAKSLFRLSLPTGQVAVHKTEG